MITMNELGSYFTKLSEVLDPYLERGVGDDPLSLQTRIVEGRKILNELKVAVKTTVERRKVLERRIVNVLTENKIIKKKLESESKQWSEWHKQAKAMMREVPRTKTVSSASLQTRSASTIEPRTVDSCGGGFASSPDLAAGKEVTTQTEPEDRWRPRHGRLHDRAAARRTCRPSPGLRDTTRSDAGQRAEKLKTARTAFRSDLANLQSRIKQLETSAQSSASAWKRVAVVGGAKSEQMAKLEGDFKAYWEEILHLREQLAAKDKEIKYLANELEGLQGLCAAIVQGDGEPPRE